MTKGVYVRAKVSAVTGNTVVLAGHTGNAELVGSLLRVVSGPCAGYPPRKITGAGSGYAVDRGWEEPLTVDSEIVVGEDSVAITTDRADCEGLWIRITGGAGVGQERIIVAKDDFYDGAIVDEPWNEGEWPDDTSTFEILPKNRLGGGNSGDDQHVGDFVSSTAVGD